MLAHVDSPLLSQMEHQTLMDSFLYVNRDVNGFFGSVFRKSPSGCRSNGYNFSQCAQAARQKVSSRATLLAVSNDPAQWLCVSMEAGHQHQAVRIHHGPARGGRDGAANEQAEPKPENGTQSRHGDPHRARHGAAIRTLVANLLYVKCPRRTRRPRHPSAECCKWPYPASPARVAGLPIWIVFYPMLD
jgi:hypothetical protein